MNDDEYEKVSAQNCKHLAQDMGYFGYNAPNPVEREKENRTYLRERLVALMANNPFIFVETAEGVIANAKKLEEYITNG